MPLAGNHGQQLWLHISTFSITHRSRTFLPPTPPPFVPSISSWRLLTGTLLTPSLGIFTQCQGTLLRHGSFAAPRFALSAFTMSFAKQIIHGDRSISSTHFFPSFYPSRHLWNAHQAVDPFDLSRLFEPALSSPTHRTLRKTFSRSTSTQPPFLLFFTNPSTLVSLLPWTPRGRSLQPLRAPLPLSCPQQPPLWNLYPRLGRDSVHLFPLMPPSHFCCLLPDYLVPLLGLVASS